MEVGCRQATQVTVKNSKGELLAVVDDNGVRTYGDVIVSVDRPGREYATLEDIEKIGGEILIPRQVANILGCAPYAINCQAESDPEKLGFPVIKIGNRVKIPKKPFLEFFRGKRKDKL